MEKRITQSELDAILSKEFGKTVPLPDSLTKRLQILYEGILTGQFGRVKVPEKN